jgi:hypothetical protein
MWRHFSSIVLEVCFSFFQKHIDDTWFYDLMVSCVTSVINK